MQSRVDDVNSCDFNESPTNMMVDTADAASRCNGTCMKDYY